MPTAIETQQSPDDPQRVVVSRAWFLPCGHQVGTLTKRAEPIDVTSDSDRGPNPDWSGTDGHGHRHHAERTTAGVRYPTLLRVYDKDPPWCEDCSEAHRVSWWVCPACGETVHPGTLGPSPFRQFIPGPTSYGLGGNEIGPGEYEWVRANLESAGRLPW
jgi:hypothetical protein